MNASGPKAYMIRGVDSMPADIASPLHLAPVEDKATLVDFEGGRLSSGRCSKGVDPVLDGDSKLIAIDEEAVYLHTADKYHRFTRRPP